MNMMETAQFAGQEAASLRGELRHDVDMSRHVSWRAGGHVQRLYQPADLDDLAEFLRILPRSEPVIAIGLGSNLLVRNGGLSGTVLLLHGALGELRVEPDGTVYAQAGVPGAKLARFAALHNLRGAEFFAGIPGTVGGMLAMNAGCYGSETWETVERVQVVDRSGELHECIPAEYEIGYRHVERKEEPGSRIKDASRQTPEFFVGVWLRFQAGDGEIARRE
ncbi:MAG TPA: FAD-binding protein, partial [Gallionellaceae bacterium]|nr:FAD-binding protein [Gallionellaceae bacterium]